MNSEKGKTLELRCVSSTWTDTKTGESRPYNRLVVTVNGLDLTLKATDYTAQKILVAYFNGD